MREVYYSLVLLSCLVISFMRFVVSGYMKMNIADNAAMPAGIQLINNRNPSMASAVCTAPSAVLNPNAASSQSTADVPNAPPNFCAMDDDENIKPVDAVLNLSSA